MKMLSLPISGSEVTLERPKRAGGHELPLMKLTPRSYCETFLFAAIARHVGVVHLPAAEQLQTAPRVTRLYLDLYRIELAQCVFHPTAVAYSLTPLIAHTKRPPNGGQVITTICA
jgi:hypothetical protein